MEGKCVGHLDSILKYIKSLNIKNKTILIRVDYNAPMSNGEIVDSFRIDSSFKTIDYCLNNNCKIVLMSHLGRPKGKDRNLSLYPIFEYLKNHFLNNEVYFAKDCISNQSFNKSNNLKSGEILLLENLRFYRDELECGNQFSEKLAKHGDIYINDAFGTAHRSHASNVGVCKYFKHKGYGFLINKEKKYLDDMIDENINGLTLILGGSKISDKIKILDRFINIADNILIGGAMSNNFLKAKGYNIGQSLYEQRYVDYAKEILLKDCRADISLPVDYICTKNIKNKQNIRLSDFLNIKNNEFAVDIGPETTKLFNNIINEKTKTVIWNGPMGIIEINEFSKGTKSIINSIKNIKNKGFISIIGGGDTSSMIEKSKYSAFTHISTGGGASLKLLSGEIMNSFEALKK